MSYIELFIIMVMSIWIISEIILFKSIKKSGNYNYIWLIINIILPIIPCIIYKLIYNVNNKNK